MLEIIVEDGIEKKNFFSGKGSSGPPLENVPYAYAFKVSSSTIAASMVSIDRER